MAVVELVCFHHAGGGSASFHSLRQALADGGADVAFQVATLPGRASRQPEPRHIDADSFVLALADELLNRPDWLAFLMPVVRDDPLAPPDMLAAWQPHSLQTNPVRHFHGGHFLFRSPDAALVSAVAEVAVCTAYQGSGIR